MGPGRQIGALMPSSKADAPASISRAASKKARMICMCPA
jgi:hypothetical protein